MSISSSDTSSETFSYTTSEITLFESVDRSISNDAEEEKCENQVVTHESFTQDPTAVVPDHLVKVKEMQKKFDEKLQDANKEIAEMCNKHREMRQQDKLSTEESVRETATFKFFDDSDNRYRLRQEDHDMRLKKLREEQLIIQESIFGNSH